jgi:hypothetical protein
LYDLENWTLRKVDQKYLESFEMWCWRRLEKIGWTDRVNNKYYMESSRKKYPTCNKKEGRINGSVTSCKETVFSNTLLKEIYKER